MSKFTDNDIKQLITDDDPNAVRKFLENREGGCNLSSAMRLEVNIRKKAQDDDKLKPVWTAVKLIMKTFQNEGKKCSKEPKEESLEESLEELEIKKMMLELKIVELKINSLEKKKTEPEPPKVAKVAKVASASVFASASASGSCSESICEVVPVVSVQKGLPKKVLEYFGDIKELLRLIAEAIKENEISSVNVKSLSNFGYHIKEVCEHFIRTAIEGIIGKNKNSKEVVTMIKGVVNELKLLKLSTERILSENPAYYLHKEKILKNDHRVIQITMTKEHPLYSYLISQDSKDTDDFSFDEVYETSEEA